MEKPNDNELENPHAGLEKIKAGAQFVRAKVMKLGLPGLLVYNGAKGTAAGIAAFNIKHGDVGEKLNSGFLWAGIAVVTSTTFWAAMAMIGHKLVKRM